jgi:hypothetical protein
MDRHSEDIRRAFATVGQVDNGNIWQAFLITVSLDREDVDRISSRTVLEGLENLTGEPHRTTTVNVWLATLTDEYGLVKRHESPNEDVDWRPSEKGRRFADLMIDDEFLANLQAIWEEIDK